MTEQDTRVGAIVRLQLQPQHEIAVSDALKREDYLAITICLDGKRLELEAQADLPAGSYRIVKSEGEKPN